MEEACSVCSALDLRVERTAWTVYMHESCKYSSTTLQSTRDILYQPNENFDYLVA